MRSPLPVLGGLGGPPPLPPVMATVDQARHGTAARRMVLPVVAIGLRQALEAAHLADGMLDLDALAGEGAVVGHILGGRGFPRGLRRGGCPCAGACRLSRPG